MANVTTILANKTGTLTTNQMTVIQCHLADKFYKSGEPIQDPVYSKLLTEAISINSSYASKTLHPKIEGEKMTQIGNKIDCALLGYVLSLGQSYQKIRYQNPEDSFLKVYPFNSIRKYMGTVIKNAETGGYRVFVKGGAEIMLSCCKWFVGPDNTIQLFENFERKTILEDVIERMTSLGLRVICIAYKDYVPKKIEHLKNGIEFSGDIDWDNESSVLENLTCLAIVGIQNAVHPDVPEAILKCQEAGITVRMVTGDNIYTARAIATSCGILKPGEDDIVLDGKEFNQRIRDENGEFSQIKMDELLPKLRVVARAQPSDKYFLAKGIIDSTISFNREVLAVTSNGTNDAPALKKADVGFAMGIAGSDVAKEASDIILTDDSFSSIVKSIMWSRNIYDSVAKFLQFQLTVNIVAVVVVFVGACVIQDTPLKAVQMLWINLIMDTFASFAFTTEPPTEDILKRKPYDRRSPIISKKMLRNIVGHAIYQLIVLIVLVFAGVKTFDIQSDPASQHFTIVFNTFVMMTLFNELNARKIHCERNIFEGLFSNPHFYWIWIFTFVFQILIVQFGGEWFSSAPLKWHHWLACLGFGVGTLLWGQIVNCIPLENLPDNIAVGSGNVVEHEDLLDLVAEDSFDEKRSKNMLWNRGEIKLRTQLRVVQAFQSFGIPSKTTVGVVNKADAKKNA
uniref:Calcium-transporting ATPase n=1 Tax=Panagrolaimus davidi TaxID=227884 RepID=A0A914PCM6_9BILA